MPDKYAVKVGAPLEKRKEGYPWILKSLKDGM